MIDYVPPFTAMTNTFAVFLPFHNEQLKIYSRIWDIEEEEESKIW